VINLVQTCSKHFLQKYCVELPTSKIHTGLNTGPKLGKPMLKRPEICYLTSPKRINANGAMSRDFLPLYWSPISKHGLTNLFPISSCSSLSLQFSTPKLIPTTSFSTTAHMQGSRMRMVRFNEVSNTKKKGITNARNNIGINYYVTLPCI
jgi:hypothetical protein